MPGFTPSVDDYLAALPHGLDAYPDYRVKGSVVRAILEGFDRDALNAVLPEAVHPVTDPRLALTAWVPEVHATVAYLAARDLFYVDDDAFVADMYHRNKKLLSSPFYRAFAKLFSEQRIWSAGRMVFNLLHDGLSLEASRETKPWRFILRGPPWLVPPLIARCYASAGQAAFELGGQRARVELEETTPTRNVIRIWTGED